MARRSSATSSTATRRPSPLRESTYPPPSSPAGPSASSVTEHPNAPYHASQARTPRPKSFINLLLRNAAMDHAASTSTTPRDAPKRSKPTRASTTDDIQSGSTTVKSLGRWDKRASRKAPLPPSIRPTEGSAPASALVSTAGPELSRQHGKQIASHGLEEEMGDLWDGPGDNGGMMGEHPSWEGIDSLPKVFLFPPEEDEIQPIKLYPPPPPAIIERPPTFHLEQLSSRPSSLFSVESSMSGNSNRNTWGGMEKQFGKPPPRFRRGGANVLAGSGIIMPKKREQVVRERERRMSTYASESMDWEAGAGVAEYDAPRRTASSPLPDSRPPVRTQESLPSTTTSEKPHPTQRSNSAPSALTMSPPMIMITSDSVGSLATETAHSAESYESAADDLAQLAHARDHSDECGTVVESPVAFTARPLSTPPSSARPLDSDEDTVVPQSAVASLASVTEPIALELDLGAAAGDSNAADVSALDDTTPSPSLVLSVSTSSTLRGDKRHKRRSMSLTSIPAPKPAEVTPAMTNAPTVSGMKVIRKHKSLKKLFFSSDHLAKHEQEPMPVARPEVTKDKGPRKEEKPEHGPGSQAAKSAQVDRSETDRTDRARAKDEKKREMNKRSSLGGMLSRPKSKPSLRIDVKASKHAVTATPSPAAESDASTPTPAPLTGSSTDTSSTSEMYPETPTSRSSSSKSKGKAGTPAPESAGGTRGLTKRFSLSNMSSAFKRSKKDGMAVPQVPELPAVYKRDKSGRSMSADSASTPTASVMRDIKHSAVPLSPKLQDSAIIDSPVGRSRPLLSSKGSPVYSDKPLPDPEPASPGALSLRSVMSASPETSGHTLNAPGSPSHDDTSILSDTSSGFELETELNHAQLVLVSPRTRRNPAESLQDILGVAPISRQSTIVKMDPVLSRRSVEAIVLGPLLMSPGDMAPLSEEDEYGVARAAHGNGVRRGSDESTSSGHAGHASSARPRHYDSESSLESLSRSSSTSDPLEHAPVTPSSVDCGPVLELPPPLPPKDDALDVELSSVSTEDAVMVDAPSMQEIYDSPTSTITASRRSPEGLFRFLSGGHSPKSAVKQLDVDAKADATATADPTAPYSTGKAPKVKGQAKGVTMTFPLPPPPPVPETKEYSSLNSDVQLRSLHFDSGLGLDFKFGFGTDDEVDELDAVEARKRDAEVEVEVLA